MEYIFHVAGMHCHSCILLTESELEDVPQVVSAKSSLETCTVCVSGDFGERTPEAIAADLTAVLAKHGYALSVEKQLRKKGWEEFAVAIPIAAALIAGFVLLQKAGIVDLVDATSVSYGTAFAIGIVASISTCMAVVGGLVLSMSATFAKGGDAVRPQLLFHGGRIVSFFLLGGVIGALGSTFRMSAAATAVLGILVGVVMLLLGVNLLDVFDWAKKLQPSMPKSVARQAHGVSRFNHAVTPLLVGIATFFLPCGFTQSMQLYALTTGGFMTGALTMLAFALGTLPVLALISFSSFSVERSPKKGVFFKSAGLIVIAFALFNIASGLASAGIIPPLFTI